MTTIFLIIVIVGEALSNQVITSEIFALANQPPKFFMYHKIYFFEMVSDFMDRNLRATDNKLLAEYLND